MGKTLGVQDWQPKISLQNGRQKRTDFWKLSSDFHMCAVMCIHTQSYTLVVIPYDYEGARWSLNLAFHSVWVATLVKALSITFDICLNAQFFYLTCSQNNLGNFSSGWVGVAMWPELAFTLQKLPLYETRVSRGGWGQGNNLDQVREAIKLMEATKYPNYLDWVILKEGHEIHSLTIPFRGMCHSWWTFKFKRSRKTKPFFI